MSSPLSQLFLPLALCTASYPFSWMYLWPGILALAFSFATSRGAVVSLVIVLSLVSCCGLSHQRGGNHPVSDHQPKPKALALVGGFDYRTAALARSIAVLARVSHRMHSMVSVVPGSSSRIPSVMAVAVAHARNASLACRWCPVVWARTAWSIAACAAACAVVCSCCMVVSCLCGRVRRRAGVGGAGGRPPTSPHYYNMAGGPASSAGGPAAHFRCISLPTNIRDIVIDVIISY